MLPDPPTGIDWRPPPPGAIIPPMNATLWNRVFFAGTTPDPVEDTTLRRYLLGMIAQGVWWAGYLLFPFVLAKSLGAGGGLVTAAVTMETAGMLLALYWGHLLARGGRRRWLFWGGLGGRAVLLVMPFVSTAPVFVGLLAVVYGFAALVYPAQNGIFQENFSKERRGGFFGYGALVQHVFAAATSLVLGRILDMDPANYRWIYPVVGCIGFLYPLTLATLPRPAHSATAGADTGIFTVPRMPLGPIRIGRLARALVIPFREAVATFRADRSFLWYEGNFMIYGMAFMMLNPVVPLFFTEELDLSYEQISSARVLIASAGVAFLGPLMGRFMDRFHPVRLCVGSFALLALYPGVLALTGNLGGIGAAGTAYLAFAMYALAMSGVNITWHVGSIAFAPEGEGSHYQGVHVAMVGARGVVGPLLGYTVMKLLGYREVFVTAALLFLLSSVSSLMLWRWLSRRGAAES